MVMASATVILALTMVCPRSHADDKTPADMVIRGGRVVTVDRDFRIVDAMAIRKGRVVTVGTNKKIAKWVGRSTRVIELRGRMVLPGLIDSHVHAGGGSRYEADHEIPSMDTIADVLSYIRGRTRLVPKGEWITLRQVFITRLKEQRYPTRTELDSVAPDHPVAFRTGPDGSANSLALQKNGIDGELAVMAPMAPMARTDMRGGDSLNLGLGLLWTLEDASRMNFEWVKPIAQDLDGVGLETDFRFFVSWSKAW